MVISAIILSTILAALGVFFGQSGERSRVNRIGYGILALIIVIGIINAIAFHLNDKSAEALAKFQATELAQANTQLVIQNINLDRPFEATWLSFDVRMRPCPEDGACSPEYGFEAADIAPFFPKQAKGEVVAFIAATLGETVVREFTLTQADTSLDVEQRIGTGELAAVSEFKKRGVECKVLRNNGSCKFLYREDTDLVSAGVTVDASTDEVARRIISDVLNFGPLLTVHIPNAYNDLGWWQILKRMELRHIWKTEVSADIRLVQREELNDEKGCRTTYKQEMRPVFSFEDKSWLQSQLYELGYGRADEGLRISYVPHGSMRVTLCRQQY